MDDFIALNSFRWRKEAQKTGIANSQYLKRTQKHIIYSISIFFFSQVCGVLVFFLSLIFLYVLLELHWFIFCEIVWVHFLFTLVLIFSLQQKNYDGNDDYEDDDRNAESDNHDQSVVVGRGICCWKIKQLIITLYPKISYSIYWYFIICYHNYKLWTTQNSLTIFNRI